MSLSKDYLLERLTDGYIKTPMSLKDLNFPRVAVRLCLYSGLRNYIFRAQPQNLEAHNREQRNFEELSKIIVNTLILPYNLHENLLAFIYLVKGQLILWINRLEKFSVSPDFAALIVTESDWTAEGILNTKGIAERIVNDGRIPVFHRYRIACLYFLENSIVSLWNLMPREYQRALIRPSPIQEFCVVSVWSSYLSGLKTKQECLFDTFLLAVIGGDVMTVIQCCRAMDEISRQSKVINGAFFAVQGIYCNSFSVEINTDEYEVLLLSYTDILCLLLSHMTIGERKSFFRRILYMEKFPLRDHSIFEIFFQQPFQSIFIPIITEMKRLVSEQVFDELHGKIANMQNCCFDKNEFIRLKRENYEYHQNQAHHD